MKLDLVLKRWAALLIGVSLAACSGELGERNTRDAGGQSALTVYATSYPLAFFAERVGGAAVDVVFPTPAGVDPAHWSPDADTVARAQRADLLLRHGAGDPAWLDLASLHRDRVVDTTAAVRDRLIERETARHQHGPEGEHSHGEWDGTTWLDPTLAAAQADAIADALAAARPRDAAAFRSNLSALVQELEALDRELATAAERLGDTPLLYSHPVYMYLQTRYGLNGKSVAWEPDQMPGDRQWRELRALLAEHPARAMLWEAEPTPEVSARLEALGVASRVFAAAAERPGPGEGDWLAVMRSNARALAALNGSL